MGDRVLELIIRAKDLTGRTVSKFRRNWRAMRRTIRNVTRTIVAFTAAAGATVLALTKLGERGDKVNAVKQAFAKITGDGAAALERLRQASKGTISDFDLMASANQAMTLGAAKSNEQFAEMVRISRVLSRAQGIDARKGLESFTIGMARMSPRILDNIGIQIKLGDETTFAARAMEQARQKADEYTASTEPAAAAAARFATAIANAKDRVATLVAESPQVAAFFDNFTDFVTDFVDILSSDADLIRDAFDSLGRIAANAFSAAFQEVVVGAGRSAIGGIMRTIQERWARLIGRSMEELEQSRARVEASIGGDERPSTEAVENIRAELVALEAIARAARSRAAARSATGGGGDGGGGPGGFVFDPSILAGISGPAVAGQAPGIRTTRERRAFLARAPEPEPGIAVPEVQALARGLGDPDDLGDKWEEAGQVAVASMSSAAAAIIAGSENIEASLVRMIANVVQSLPGVGGLTGALIGGVGGIFGALFSRRRDPVPVRMDDVADRAARKIRDSSREPIHITSIIEQGGVEISRIERVLRDRQNRDEVVRFGIDGLPLGGG